MTFHDAKCVNKNLQYCRNLVLHKMKKIKYSVICAIYDLFICDFAYVLLRTYPLIYSNPWSIYLRIWAYFWYLAYNERNLYNNLCLNIPNSVLTSTLKRRTSATNCSSHNIIDNLLNFSSFFPFKLNVFGPKLLPTDISAPEADCAK